MKEALEYFNLGVDFTEEELETAYINKISELAGKSKVPNVDNKKLEENHNHYILLYKWSKIKYIENTYLKDIIISNVNKEDKNKIINMPKDCVDFYCGEQSYQSKVNMLLANVKSSYDLFCKIDLEKANTIEEIDLYVEKLELEIKKDLAMFTENIIQSFRSGDKNRAYTVNIPTSRELDNINSIKEVIISVYERTKKITNKKEYIDYFVKLIKAYLKPGEEEYIKTIAYYGKMLTEKDNDAFFKIYNEGIRYFIKTLLGKYHQLVQNNLTPGTEAYITAMEYYGFLSVEERLQKFLTLYDEGVKYIDSFSLVNKPPQK